jgi:2,5-furandicarboxylate decarboxylase 1
VAAREAPGGSDQDLRAFILRCQDERPGDVLVVDEELSPDQDVTALVWALAGHGREEMILCRALEGFDRPLVTNVFASRSRIAWMLGTDLTGLHSAYQALSRQACPPVAVTGGPVTARVAQGEEVDVAALPLITHFQSDRAPYITSGIVCARHPVTGAGNLSYHRAMVHSRHQLATSLHSRGHLWQMLEVARERGQVLPAAMVIGAHPLYMLAASARVGAGVDETWIAGGLMGRPLEVVPTPGHGIAVPAHAEVVLEGVLDPGVEVEEGPFGEFTGYSSDRSTKTLFNVSAVLQRQSPIAVDVAGGNSAEHLNLARVPRESEMAEKLMERFPSVAGVHYPTSGTHFHCYVALRQRRQGEARQVLLALLGWDPYLKTAVAVDDDVDITDDGSVLWALATHFQPHRDLFMIDGLPGSPLDPSSSARGTTSRLGLDATRGPAFDARPIEISEGALARAQRILDGSPPSPGRQP